MSIITDFEPYTTVGGYLCPNPIQPGTVRGCDNEPLFTSIYGIILNSYGLSYPQYQSLIAACVNSDGYLTRAPGDTTVGNPDDHYGVYAALVILNIKPMFKFYWQLLRMPWLLFAHFCAKGYAKPYNVLLWPLAAITALIIAFSGMGVDPSDSNSRILCWCLIKATAPKSILCRLASNIWYKRLNKDYTKNMASVAGLYFYPQGLYNNPYSMYWTL